VNHPDWPLFDLRIVCRGVELRTVREADLPALTAVVPPDYEQDPKLEPLPGLSFAENQRRLFYQVYYAAMGTWSPSSWALHLAVRHQGALVGVQVLEGDDFPVLRTVDSASWLVEAVRGRGLGVAMRIAVLGLAFDHLGALAAITSARADNHASLGVSRRVGYTDNGIGFVGERTGRAPLQHLRLPAENWRHGDEVTVHGLDACRPWFGLD
jgi:RimJ/RimL family protein N-acetyltransferase